MKRVSIRFFNEREVRAAWDDAAAKWWFSVLDVVGAINGESDYSKTRNYWKYLKTKLKREGNELVSDTTQLKLIAPDGKRRLSDVLDSQKMCVNWSKIGKRDYLDAMVKSVTSSTAIEKLISKALTDKIADREIFMKGIDYSYYYEEED